ncbi:hypothetical protein EDD73_12540 [Heliophilum fasciatum]|uniref:Uncharacterized protein n=1 Tax=Heliophilum fasciatum TaxID=35700 RepID=A0A4R2RGV2_9FIRM|nr:hypothetical protein [Heliophilum fasciatum]TCP61808.1 hypothetical protein EDD73_12540 [Heliophilum fasciatum]
MGQRAVQWQFRGKTVEGTVLRGTEGNVWGGFEVGVGENDLKVGKVDSVD